MRSAAWLVLGTSLLESALPAAAHQNTPEAPSIARSLAGEAARIASGGSDRADAEWSRVSKLSPGAEIVLTTAASRPAHRYLVAADDSKVTVLDAGDPDLPASARDVLRGVASSHPEYLLSAREGRRFVLDKNVRVGPYGVFVADGKVADLGQIVEQYDRHQVTEISTAKIDSNPVGCALAGYYAGAIVGGFPGAFIGRAVGRDTGPALVGMMAGWSIGSISVYRKCRHKPERVIYSAP